MKVFSFVTTILGGLLAIAVSVCGAYAADKTNTNKDSGVYARFDTGPSISNSGTSPILGAGLGYRFNGHLRADATIAHRGTFDISKSGTLYGIDTTGTASAQSWAGMLNVYGDITTVGSFTPYIGGGIGLSHNQLSNIRLSGGGYDATMQNNSNTTLAWQLSTGTAIALTDTLSLDLGYRFFNNGAYKTRDTIFVATSGGNVALPIPPESKRIYAHEVQLGMRYAF